MQTPTLANAEPIPGYRLIERLGRGGYGEVWKAEAPGGMHKAIKFVFGDMDGAGDDVKGAEQEFRSLNRVKTIRHPFLLSLERIEVVDGRLIIVMELADRNLLDRFHECGESGLPGIPRPELLRYMEESAEALDLMNLQYQIQHLDIKPQNIFLVHRHVKVADFGLAKDLEGARADLTGGITPMYAPPETFEGWISRQSDQYSLAIVYMEMLTGKRPFNGTNTRQLIMQHMTGVPDLAPLPENDRAAVARALSKKPDERFPTCTEFVRALLGEQSPPSIADSKRVATGQSVGKTAATLSQPAGAVTGRAAPGNSKLLPALVTQKSKKSDVGAQSTVRGSTMATPVPARAAPVVAETPGDGVLVPALIVGIGGTGLGMMRSFRKLIVERFGRPTLPHLRWLFIDTDPATAESAISTGSSVALAPEEVIITRLNRPTHYLSRDGLPPVDAWLKQEELFKIPRSLATEGMRALGRLALCDHYPALNHRLRAALEPLLNNAGLTEAQRLTGLGQRSNLPRVYLATALTGGTGSGMLLDLAYLLRRELQRLGVQRPHLVGMLGTPAWAASGASSAAHANARAALTEISHFSHADTTFQAQYDRNETPLQDAERPFRRCTLIPLPGVSDRIDHERANAMASQVLFAELLTPLGRTAYPDNVDPPARALSIVGMQRLVWPRAAILRLASARLAQRALSAWLEKKSTALGPTVAQAIETHWTERQLARPMLRSKLEAHLATALGNSAVDAVAQCLKPLTDRAEAKHTDAVRVLKSFRLLMDLVGRPGADDNDQPHTIGTMLTTRSKEIAAHADTRMLAAIVAFIEQPGLRLAGADEAINIFRARLTEELAVAEREVAAIDEQALASFAPLHPVLMAANSDPTARGGSHAIIAENLAAPLRQWAMTRLKGHIAKACASVYRALLGGIPEYVRELNLVRGQLAAFLKQFGDDHINTKISDGVCRSVYHDGSTSAVEAAERLVDAVGPDDLREYENALQARVRHECRGLLGACSRPKDHGPAFQAVLLDQSSRFLERRLPPSTSLPAGALPAEPAEFEHRVAALLDDAAPVDLGQGRPTATILGTPGLDGALGEFIKRLCNDTVFRTAPTPGELVLWRESPGLSLADLPNLAVDPNACEGPRLAGSAYTRSDVAWRRLG